jgi:hypothetical protein
MFLNIDFFVLFALRGYAAARQAAFAKKHAATPVAWSRVLFVPVRL